MSSVTDRKEIVSDIGKFLYCRRGKSILSCTFGSVAQADVCETRLWSTSFSVQSTRCEEELEAQIDENTRS